MISFDHLRYANLDRAEEWTPDVKPDLSFRGIEMTGEIGEAIEVAFDLLVLAKLAGRAGNVVKKLERERHGWAGSRASKSDLADELADIIITADLVAIKAGIDLGEAVKRKFNSTSEKVGLETRM